MLAVEVGEVVGFWICFSRRSDSEGEREEGVRDDSKVLVLAAGRVEVKVRSRDGKISSRSGSHWGYQELCFWPC